MTRFFRWTLVALVTLILSSCTYMGFNNHDGQANLPPISADDFKHVKTLAVFLSDSVLQGKADSEGITKTVQGQKGIVRFKDLDLDTVRFQDGSSLMQRFAASSGLLWSSLKGQFVFTGYLDQSDGRMLHVRVIVEGEGVDERFLFEASIDRITDKWTAKVDGVEYKL
ncbi:MAG: hypothetical protein WCR91_03720 [Sphaerochaetaceae bacterium]|nr:hypothetical protein [Sphaerochaetaceae bacterium]MDX9808866.1 hypothetical protein [Sphaerochaetaceae bacterium]